MIDTFTTTATRLSVGERKFLADHLTRSGSDFQTELLAGGQAGVICLAMSRGEIVGWARTAWWESWPTLEAFVAPAMRRRGVAVCCAAGLAAGGQFEESGGYCAVFDRAMLPIAGRAGLNAILFSRVPGGWAVDWRRG